MTPEGEINIEELRIGDNVLAASGKTKPIKFIGLRKVSRERTGPWNGDSPVKISRFAIDGKAPHSDLRVSPVHAIDIDGTLIRAGNLVNSVTLVADAKPEALSLTYLHIELDMHEAHSGGRFGSREFPARRSQASMSDCMAHRRW
jgi:Hint domain